GAPVPPERYAVSGCGPAAGLSATEWRSSRLVAWVRLQGRNRASNFSFALATFTPFFGWLTRSTSAAFRCRHPPYPPGYDFPLPFGRWPWLLGPSCSPWGVSAALRPAYWNSQTPWGFPRSTSERGDERGCPLYSGVAVSLRERLRPLSTPGRVPFCHRPVLP